MPDEFDSSSRRGVGGGRIPPQSDEAEKGVLGSILVDAGRVMDLCVERQIVPESFHNPRHRAIYACLIDMHRESVLIDSLTVTERLSRRGDLDTVGGALFLTELIDSTPTSAHAGHYIDLVREKDILRRIIACARDAEGNCYDTEEAATMILDRVEQSFLDITESQHGTMTPWADSVKKTVEHVDHVLETGKGLMGLSTGYLGLDDKLHGLRPSEMIVLAARPSMGKTSLAMNIVERVALGKGDPDSLPHAVGVFSLEMSAEALVLRMLCSHAKVRGEQIAQGYLAPGNHRRLISSASLLGKAPIYLDDSGGLDVMELRARARRMKKRYGIELVVIDYLQMLHSREYARQGRQLETANISNHLKAMAKELKVPVLVLSQLSRAPEQREGKPRLSDLRDSGAIEQDADVVCMLRRPHKYAEDPEAEDKTLAVVDVAKQRNGPTGEILFNFSEEFTRFDDRDDRRGVDHIPEIEGAVPMAEMEPA